MPQPIPNALRLQILTRDSYTCQERVLYHGKGSPRPGTIIRRLSLGDNGLVRVKLDDDGSIRQAVSEETALRRKGRAYWTLLGESA